jgi:molybdate transport system permease protein
VIALFFRITPAMFVASLEDPFVYQALAISVLTAAASLVVIVGMGTPAMYFHARSVYRGKTLVDCFIDLPLVLPPAVAGLALLLLFGRTGLIGYYFNLAGYPLPFTTLAVVMAQVFVASPFYLRQAKELFGQLDPVYEQTARTLGASPVRVFFTITLPLTSTGLISGAVMSFARALGEFGATIMFAGNLPGVTQTMPLAIYSAMQGNIDAAITLGIVLVLFSLGIMGAIRVIMERGAGNA